MSKASSRSANEPNISLGSDHLEEVVDSYFQQKKREVTLVMLAWTIPYGYYIKWFC